MVTFDENKLLEIAKVITDLERDLALKKVVLEHAIADIPHTCDFCMSKRCTKVAYDCDGCKYGSHWRWYGVM